MPAKKKPRQKKLKTYPSVIQMIAATSPPKRAIGFMADIIRDLQERVRILELKVAVNNADAKTRDKMFKIGSMKKPAMPRQLEKLRTRLSKKKRR